MQEHGSDAVPVAGFWARRRRVLAIAGAVALVAGGAGVAIAAVSGSGGKHAASASTGGNGGAGGASTSSTTRAGGARGASTTVAPGGTPTTRRSGSEQPTTQATGPAGSTATTVAPGAKPTTKPGKPGSQVTATVPPPPPSIEQAYVQGFQDECHALWSQAGPDGQLWDADSVQDGPHTVDECLSALDPYNAVAWTDYTPAQARAGGKDDADSAADDMTVGNRFQNSSGLVIYIP